MLTQRTTQWLTLALVCSALSACFGGSIAQQLVRSALLKGADKVTESAIEQNERKAEAEAIKNAEIDPYTLAFANAEFTKITPQVEALPETAVTEEEVDLPLMQETKLVQVEVWSLLAGEEKESVLEKARMQGSLSIPPKTEWKKCQIAQGATDKNQQPITFLIPPEMGKMRSGAKAMVEIFNTGELNIARYALN